MRTALNTAQKKTYHCQHHASLSSRSQWNWSMPSPWPGYAVIYITQLLL